MNLINEAYYEVNPSDILARWTEISRDASAACGNT